MHSLAWTLEVSLASCEEGLDTGEEIIRRAFPALHAAQEGSWQDEEALDAERPSLDANLRKVLRRPSGVYYATIDAGGERYTCNLSLLR